MPIRVHELLLNLAGRLDDDALGDARQMLASAELDRSLEFIAGCLEAGRVVLTKAEQHEIDSLFADTYLDPGLIDQFVVRDPAPMVRHRFAIGLVDGREPDRGVADAIRPVLDVLPDVRSVWCVWRLTPAGPASGPVPHRVVLVGVGPGGFAPATAYRVEYALRHVGIRASVEVLVDGNQPSDYHQEAMRCAQQVPFGEPDSVTRPRVSPADPVRAEPLEPPRMAAPGQPFGGEQRYDQPVEPPHAEAAPALPPPIELPQAAPALPPPVELSRPEEPREFPPPISLHRGEPDSFPTPPRGALAPVELYRADPAGAPVDRALPPPVELRRPDEAGPGLPPQLESGRPDGSGPGFPPPVELRRPDESGPGLPPPMELRRPDEQGPGLPPPGELFRADQPPQAGPGWQPMPGAPVDRALPPPVELRRPDGSGPGLQPSVDPHGSGPRPGQPTPPPVGLPPAESAQQAFPVPGRVPRRQPGPGEETSVFAQERLPAEPADKPAELPPSALNSEAPTNSRPSPRRRPKSKDGTRPRLAPVVQDGHSAKGGDILNTQERSLLRELQDELARREKQDEGSTSASTWSGRHNKSGLGSPRPSGGPMMINGVPPNSDGRGQPPVG